MKVMKQPLGVSLFFCLITAGTTFAQTPLGGPLISTNQSLGKPGVHISVSQNTRAIGYSYDTAPYTHGSSPGLSPSDVVRVFQWNGSQLVYWELRPGDH